MKKIFFSFVILLLSTKLSADTIVVSKSGKADFRTVQEALNAIPVEKNTWTVVIIKSGIYNEKLVLDSGKNRVKIVGERAENTIITWNDHSGKIVNGDTIRTGTSFTFSIRGNDVIIENLTIENTAGPTAGQAVACETQGDRIAFFNCKLLGDQDTFYTRGIGRVYVKNCYIEGTTDFIFGSSIVCFEYCHIFCKKNSYITAASTPEKNEFGYVFKNCKITALDTVTQLYLGRPWRDFAQTVFMFCEIDASIHPERWHHWQPHRKRTAFYAEYCNFGRGADTSNRAAWSYILTDEQAKRHVLENIFEDWIPTSEFK